MTAIYQSRIMSVLILFFSCISLNAFGQVDTNTEIQKLRQELESYKPGNTTFLMRGYAHAGYQWVDEHSTFVTGTFAPIFLWRQSDHILFEAEAEITYSESGSSFALEYANIAYILNDYLILRLGNFLTPFGIFGERLHPNWINRFSTNPLGFDHHNPVGPFSEIGMELRGGAPLGDSRINYAFYISNGPRFTVDTSVDPIVAGTSYSNISDNNDHKALGGRIGILPFGNSSLELGVSGQYAKLGDRDTGFEDVSSFMYAADLTYVKNSIAFLKGGVDLKAQWNYVEEDEVRVIDLLANTTTIDNDLNAYFGMFSYRPSLSSIDFLSRTEFVVRYSVFNVVNENLFVGGGDGHDHTHQKIPEALQKQAVPGFEVQELALAAADLGALNEDKTQWAFGINYWVSWRALFKLSFQRTSNSEDIDGFYIHYALGF